MKWAGMVVLTVIAVLAACMSTQERRATAGTAVSAETADLRLDERYIDPSGGLEVQPINIGVDSATLAVRVDGISRTIELRPGSLGRQTVAPYTFELIGTSMEPSVSILITRED